MDNWYSPPKRKGSQLYKDLPPANSKSRRSWNIKQVLALLLWLLLSHFSCVQLLCDPIDGSPPGSPVPGILQARILEWGAIAFSVLALPWNKNHGDTDLWRMNGFPPGFCRGTWQNQPKSRRPGNKMAGSPSGLSPINSWDRFSVLNCFPCLSLFIPQAPSFALIHGPL